MPLDPALENLISAEIGAGMRESARLSGIADRNLTQGLGVIHNTLIQQAGGVADDAALFAAMNTASRVPASGAVT